uniref:Uncharacterized protein n=1 Tax=Macaca fascicularis TaxID=9541 RepID=A0A7N9CU42_MACFA
PSPFVRWKPVQKRHWVLCEGMRRGVTIYRLQLWNCPSDIDF